MTEQPQFDEGPPLSEEEWQEAIGVLNQMVDEQEAIEAEQQRINSQMNEVFRSPRMGRVTTDSEDSSSS